MKSNSSAVNTNVNKPNWVSETISNNYSSFKSVTTSIEGSNVYIYAVGYKSLFDDDNDETFITKWDVNGTLIWQKKTDKSNNDMFYSVTTSNEGSNVYIYAVGYSYSSTNSNYEAFITKWNTDGSLVWQKKIGKNNVFKSVVTSIEENNVYLYAVGYENLFEDNCVNAFITKWDVNGTLLWQKKIDGYSGNYFNSVTTSIEGNNIFVYAVGDKLLPKASYTEAFITKWNKDGSLVWQKKIDEDVFNVFYSVTTSIEENNVYLYAVGYKCSFADNHAKAFITKWDVNGTLVWQRKINEGRNNAFKSVVTSIEENNVYLYAVGYDIPVIVKPKAIITKWNTDGSLVWHKKISEGNNNLFNSVTVSVEGNNTFVYAVGNKVSSTYNNRKAFITKWNVNGNIISNQLVNIS